MFTTPDDNKDAARTPIFDPFPEPVTMPSGWDLSGLNTEPEPERAAASITDEYAGTAFYTNFLP